jgi:benzoylformate decarboxylase
MGARRGRDVVLEVLRSEVVRHLFGNPGTTELPLVDAVAGCDDVRYVLALHEATVVGMAEGYAMASGRPSVCSLHTGPGLGNAMGNLTNALAHGTPMVVTAGQQDRRHRHLEPLLQADLVAVATGAVKRATEVGTLGELGTVLRRAFHEAMAPPAGPVFVSIPMDVLDEEGEAPVPESSVIDRRSVSAAVDDLATRCGACASDRIVIVASDEVAQADATAALVRVAEALGARVHGSPLHGRTVFPTTHPLWAGPLPATAPGIRRALAPYEVVLLLGARPLFVLPYSPEGVVPEGVDLLHVAADAHELARVYPLQLGASGDLRATLDALADRLRVRPPGEWSAVARGDHEGKATALYDGRPVHPMAAVHALLRAAPDDVAVVDEAITASAYVRGFHRADRPGRYYSGRGAGLGWGMPAALGVALALGEPVLCVVGDGAAMYSPQALWTAARERLPVVFAVLANRRYRVLDGNLRQLYGDDFHPDVLRALALDDPAVDFAALATSLGVPAATVDRAADIGDVVRAALASGGPFLLELPVTGGA